LKEEGEVCDGGKRESQFPTKSPTTKKQGGEGGQNRTKIIICREKLPKKGAWRSSRGGGKVAALPGSYDQRRLGRAWGREGP